jgi:GDP-mannose 4,6-dehydratase
MTQTATTTTSPKVALITGVTGQDGAYLSELLLAKGYEVHGIKRRSSLFNTDRIDHLYQDPHVDHQRFTLHYGDLTDSTNLIRIIQQVQPDEIYNLAAMSHVAVSFETPEYTANADGIGTLRILEAIRILGLEKKTRFYQASTSELYGLVQETPQKETTPFYPRSPYAVAKLYGYWITVNYREAYGMYACNGILFNHESPLRGDSEYVVWGSGTPRREFLHVDDLADACVHLMERGYDGPPLNIGTGEDVTIRELAGIVMQVVGFEGRIVFDHSKPDGTPRKLLDVSRLAAFGWQARIPLRAGIQAAYDSAPFRI